MSYLIPDTDLTLSEKKEFRKRAKNQAISEALKLALATDEKGLTVRDILPATDLGAPAGSGYTNEVFITGAIAAITWTSVYDTAGVAQLGTRKVLVIYKIFNHTPMPNVTEVEFRLGLTGTSTLARFHTEGVIGIELTPEAYMSEPVVYTKEQWVDIRCYARAAIVTERLGFKGFIVEPLGETLS